MKIEIKWKESVEFPYKSDEQENQEQWTTKPMILPITLAPFSFNLLPNFLYPF